MDILNILIAYIQEFIGLFEIVLLVKVVAKCKLSLKLKLLVPTVMFHFILFFVLKLNDQIVLSLTISLLIQFFILFIIVPLSMKKKIYVILFAQIIVNFINAILFSFLNIQVQKFSIQSLFSYIISFAFIIFMLYIYQKKISKSEDDTDFFMHNYLSLGTFIAFFLILIVDYYDSVLSGTTGKILISASCVLVLVNLFIFISHRNKVNENEEYKKVIELNDKIIKMQTQHFEEEIRNYEDLRKFKHDINAYLNTITYLLENQKYDEILQFVNKTKITVISSVPSICSNVYIAAIINSFLKPFKDNEVYFTINYNVCNEILMEESHICSLFYNLITNAYESCIQLDTDKFITLDIYDRNAVLVINIKNSVKKEFDIGVIEKQITSKENKVEHGLGLKNINHIVNMYNGDIDVKYKDDFVCFSIILLNATKYEK